MLTIPRVAQLRICGHLTSWLWNRLCLFISDKQKQRKKEDSLCRWWLGHWFYRNVLLMRYTHKNKLYQFPIQEYLIFCDDNSWTWPETTQRVAEGEDPIFQYSVWSWKGSLSSTAFFVHDPWDVTGSVDLSHVPIRLCAVNFLNSRLSLSPHGLPIKFKCLPNHPIFRLCLDPGHSSVYVAISVCECCLCF